jgi:hypothetical protein
VKWLSEGFPGRKIIPERLEPLPRKGRKISEGKSSALLNFPKKVLTASMGIYRTVYHAWLHN